MAIHFPHVPATFRNIPRNASNSFKVWARENFKDCIILDKADEPYSLRHISMRKIKETWPNFGTTFAFVRNPFARLVSMFHQVGQAAELRLERHKKGLPCITTLEQDIKILSIYKKGFAYWVSNPQDIVFNVPLIDTLTQRETQVRWLDNTVPNIIIKLEEIDKEFYKIQDLLGCDAPFVHVNKSVHEDYRSYYDNNTRKIVEEQFKFDLMALKYEF